MGERSEYRPGTFSWADLATTDPDGAERFYGELFGWQAEEVPAGEGGFYAMCRLNGSSVAAIGKQPDEQRGMGIPPHWNNYVTVASVDESAKRAGELGATVPFPPFDVLEAGRMAVIQDPTGAHLSIWEPRDSIGATRVNEPGCLTWNDLNTPDPDTAREFYAALFGWAFEKMPSDEVDYWVIKNGERSNGGMMGTQQSGVPPFWMPYFAVEDVERTAEQAASAGGGKHAGPIEVPSGRVSVLHDPAGATFAVAEGEFDD
jgi:uncharacterized protein